MPSHTASPACWSSPNQPYFISKNSSVAPSTTSYSPPATNELPFPNLISSPPVLVFYAGFLTQRNAKSPAISHRKKMYRHTHWTSWTICNVLAGLRMRMHALVSISEPSLTFQVPTMSLAQSQVLRCPAMRSLSETWANLCVWWGSEDSGFWGVRIAS